MASPYIIENAHQSNPVKSSPILVESLSRAAPLSVGDKNIFSGIFFKVEKF
jgi:hypothetical protein